MRKKILKKIKLATFRTIFRTFRTIFIQIEEKQNNIEQKHYNNSSMNCSYLEQFGYKQNNLILIKRIY